MEAHTTAGFGFGFCLLAGPALAAPALAAPALAAPALTAPALAALVVWAEEEVSAIGLYGCTNQITTVAVGRLRRSCPGAAVLHEEEAGRGKAPGNSCTA